MSIFTWALLAALTWGTVPIFEKIGLVKIEPLVALFYRCFGVMVGIILLGVFKGPAIKQSLHNLHTGMICLVIAGFLASFVGQIFFYHALKEGDVSRVVPLAATFPLVSFILSIIILGENVTLAKMSGIAFVLMGVFLLK